MPLSFDRKEKITAQKGGNDKIFTIFNMKIMGDVRFVSKSDR